MCFNVSVYYSPQGPEWRPRELWVRLPGRPTRAGSHVSGPSQKPQEDLQRHGSLALLDPLSAGAPGGPGGETVGVEQMPRPGEGGRPVSPTFAPPGSTALPPRGFREQSLAAAPPPCPPASPTEPSAPGTPPRLFGWWGWGGGDQAPARPPRVGAQVPPTVSLPVPELQRPGSIPGPPGSTPR